MPEALRSPSSSEIFGELTSVFLRHSVDNGFRTITTGADRHGSYVWEASRTREAVSSIVTLALTPYVGASERDYYLCEVWIAADDGHQFGRRLYHQKEFLRDRLLRRSTLNWLSPILIEAFQRAASLTEVKLAPQPDRDRPDPNLGPGEMELVLNSDGPRLSGVAH